jgi:hypothetical protein
LNDDPYHIKFLSEVVGDTADDIYTYYKVLDFIELDSLEIVNNIDQIY